MRIIIIFNCKHKRPARLPYRKLAKAHERLCVRGQDLDYGPAELNGKARARMKGFILSDVGLQLGFMLLFIGVQRFVALVRLLVVIGVFRQSAGAYQT